MNLHYSTVRAAIHRAGIAHRPYRTRQDGDQVKVTYHPDAPIPGRTMAQTVDTMLTELSINLANHGVGMRFDCTAIEDPETGLATVLIVTNRFQEPVLPPEPDDVELAELAMTDKMFTEYLEDMGLDPEAPLSAPLTHDEEYDRA